MFNKPLSSITYKDINELLYIEQKREDVELEYKREFHKDPIEFSKDIISFANATGGTIIFGVDEDKNEVAGITDKVGNGKIDDWIPNVLFKHIDKKVVYEIRFIPISESIEQLFILIIKIFENEEKPIYLTSKNIAYIRKGSSNLPATPSDYKFMYEQGLGNKNSSRTTLNQKLKGKNNLQIGINQGTVIKTNKIVKKNEIVTDPNTHISESQAKEIKGIVDNIVSINIEADQNLDKSKVYPKTWNSLYKIFDITSYKLLQIEDFNSAIAWLNGEIAYKHRPKLRKGNNTQWKKKMYSAIYAKS